MYISRITPDLFPSCDTDSCAAMPSTPVKREMYTQTRKEEGNVQWDIGIQKKYHTVPILQRDTSTGR